MSFEQKFKLLEAIPDLNGTPDQELLGREIATGRPVVVHLLARPTGPEDESLVRHAKSLASEQKESVLEAGDFRGRPYVVTEVLPGNVRLRKWIARTAPPPPPAAPEPPAKAEPGEFTRLFQAPAAPPPQPASAAEPAKPVRHEPGEFTKLFKAGSGSSPVASPAPSTLR